ncbi:MAG: hypothetical protein IKS41_02005 [Alphaproteobacteria bacterium]|nr:hypothetical protein [Alphaproteobacteria bacterium]
MKKIIFLCAGLMLLGACTFHSKQPLDETYYKNTQSVAWPDDAPSSNSKTSK